jgi:hypothetical protein
MVDGRLSFGRCGGFFMLERGGGLKSVIWGVVLGVLKFLNSEGLKGQKTGVLG